MLKILRKILRFLPYFITLYIGDKLGAAYRLSCGLELTEKLAHIHSGLLAAFASPFLSFHPPDILCGMLLIGVYALLLSEKRANAKKYRIGIEYGSARFGTQRDIAPFIDPVYANNILLTRTERLTMNQRPKNQITARNKNVLVIGGSGSGKTRFYIKPQLMQMHSSYVVTDPKGQLITETGKMLSEHGYKIKILNTVNFKKSMKYNPFAYLRSEKDILKLVTVLLANTNTGTEKGKPDFWEKAESLLYSALIGYIYYEAPEEEKNFTTLLAMLNEMEVRENDETFQNAVDILFKRLEEKAPEHFAVRQYKKYKLAAGVVCFRRLLNQSVRKSPKTYNLT